MSAAKRTASASSRGAKKSEGTAGRGRLVDGIVEQLRQMILEHRIEPGTVLLQTEWSERLQVSRTPLREAFRILEQDGLVQVSNGNRTIKVASFTGPELRDLYEVREVIDGLAARLLATNGLEPGAARELEGLLEVMNGTAVRFDPATYFPAHMRFHMLIAELCGNRRVRQQLDLIKMTSFSLHSYLSDMPADSERLTQILEIGARQHRAIYDALRSGSGELAEMAACRHIRTTLNSDLIEGAARETDRRAG